MSLNHPPTSLVHLGLGFGGWVIRLSHISFFTKREREIERETPTDSTATVLYRGTYFLVLSYTYRSDPPTKVLYENIKPGKKSAQNYKGVFRIDMDRRKNNRSARRKSEADRREWYVDKWLFLPSGYGLSRIGLVLAVLFFR